MGRSGGANLPTYNLYRPVERGREVDLQRVPYLRMNFNRERLRTLGMLKSMDGGMRFDPSQERALADMNRGQFGSPSIPDIALQEMLKEVLLSEYAPFARR